MKRVAVISAILERPRDSQHLFNEIVAGYKDMVRGRLGIPLMEAEVTVISITVVGDINDINSLTGKLGKLPDVQVKTSISKKEII